MPLFQRGETPAARKRARLNQALISKPCPDCAAGPAAGCDWDCPHGTLIRLDRSPALLVHVTRAAAILRQMPWLRRLVLAQFEPGTVPAELITTRR